MKRKERKLARLVLGALVAGSGALYMTSAEANTYYTITTDTTINDETHQNDIVKMNASSIALTIASGGKVYGIETGEGQTGNTITVYGTVSPYAQSIVGGATNMKVYIKEGADIMASVRAGAASGTTKVTNNLLEMSGGRIHDDNLIGGAADSGDATVNTVNISGGTGIRRVVGGSSTYGNATDNTINIMGGTISGNTTSGNVYGGASYGGAAKNAAKNSVNISGGSVTNDIYGGYAKEGAANENTVTISRGTVNGNIYGGKGGTEASGNTVTISGGTINGTVIGGQSSSGNATGNVVNLNYPGGSITGGMVTGGMTTSGTASDNTVNVLAAMTLQGINGGTGGASSNNTVNFAAKGVTITDGIYGAENMNFYLPSDIAANDPVPMVTVNGGATTLDGVTIGAAALTGVNLSKGDSVTLLKNANGFTGTAATTTLTTQPKATSLTVNKSYKFTIAQNTNDVTATVADVNASENEQAKSLVETRAATTTFVNAGADMLASQGFAQAANAVALEAAEKANANEQGAAGTPAPNAFTPFAAFGGSSMRAESGSYVNTKGFGLNIGFARELSNAQGKLLFGPMVEYGGGSYDSHLDDGTRGDGKAHYFGVGVMARQVNHDGFYYEGSLRGGRVTSDYDGNLDGIGKVDYDSSSNYFAAHLGAGKAFDLGKGNTLDGYFKYFYSHQAGDDTTVHIAGMADERGHFDAVDSHRIRLGARLTHKVNERNSFYGGLAYQYEFNGDARATFSGNGVPSPSLKGSSGLLELGWQVKPGDGPLKLDLGVTGWAGKQRGGSVQLGATWTF